VEIVEPIEGLDIKVFINTRCNGHELVLKTDGYFLLVHQNVIDNRIQILRNLNNMRLTLAHFKRGANI
jgi:hypothetical protein